ncbi:MAG: 3-phosphoshikimate 1-carboxyvinyltransferase [Bacteroidota bacterium]|nr:3-phosphoshikimate 1-carboxyvinyltransferase [Bacteroidota bacterium]
MHNEPGIFKITSDSKSLNGLVRLSSSKSESNRVLIIRALCGSDFQINNLSTSTDTQILKKYLCEDNRFIDIGAAGTAMRFLTAYLSVFPGSHIITGSERMKKRPVGILVDALRSIGADIQFLENSGYPPLKIEGRNLKGGIIEIDGSVSSQYITALLLIAPKLESDLTVRFKGNISSGPYINMTLNIMKYFGVNADWRNNEIFIGKASYIPREYFVEADWSSASYFYLMAALSSDAKLCINGLRKNSNQGDSVIAEIMENFGVRTDFNNDGIVLSKNTISTDNFEFNFTDCPDLAQTVTVLCAALNVKSRLNGLESLRIKETDRITALVTELSKLGYNVKDENNSLIITPVNIGGISGQNKLIKTYEDHRMALAFAPLALVLDEINIQNPEVVSKSFPEYWNELKKIGFEINEI